MPLLQTHYDPPLIFRNGHLSTIYSGAVRRVKELVQQRERLELTDGDFLDLDWSFAKGPATRAAILLHGLEGNAQRPYITGSAKLLTENGIDVCAINYRGCSGEPNRSFRSYHSGATEDLEAVVRHILDLDRYKSLYIKGFSLGGNITLKYLGGADPVPKQIKAGIAISVPCHLYSSLTELLKPKNILYADRFKKKLIEKLKIKQALYPQRINRSDIGRIRTLKDFDDIYTSRAHGFTDAMDYYEKCSSLPFLKNIGIPTLIINARNDSFLGNQCYPIKEAERNKALFLELPNYGGHVGFYDRDNVTYTEKRAINFIEGHQ